MGINERQRCERRQRLFPPSPLCKGLGAVLPAWQSLLGAQEREASWRSGEDLASSQSAGKLWGAEGVLWARGAGGRLARVRSLCDGSGERLSLLGPKWKAVAKRRADTDQVLSIWGQLLQRSQFLLLGCRLWVGLCTIYHCPFVYSGLSWKSGSLNKVWPVHSTFFCDSKCKS